MTYEEYIKKLNRLKEYGERAVIKKLPDLERQVTKLMMDFIDDNLDVKDGSFVANSRAAAALNNFSDFMLAGMTELSDYKGNVGQFLKNFKDMGTLIQEFHDSQGVNVKNARLGAVQEIVTNEVINRYTENGLNEGFVQPLREIMYNNITGGMNKREAMDFLEDYIMSGKDGSGKLSKYLEQTAQQGVDSYTGAINVRIMQQYKINTYIMSGSLIKTSSKQCRYALEKMEGIIDRKDWPKLEKLAKEDGLIEGTTFDNLPINKLHWGCRHEFTPIILTEKQRESITENSINQ